MATKTIYANASWHRNAGAGQSWATCPTGSDGIAYGGVGGASSGANYYTWIRFPNGSSNIVDPNKYTITAANLYVYCEYHNVVRADFTDAYASSFTPSGTNTPSKSLHAWRYTLAQGNWYNSNSHSDSNNVLAFARGLQSGTYNGLYFCKGGVGQAYYEIGAINSASTAYRPYLVITYSGRTCTIKYNANGGSGAPGNQTYTYGGSSIKLSSTKPTRTGYTFLGWSLSSSATSASYSAGQTWSSTNAGDYTLYAVWKINTYTVSYNANGGSGAPSSQTKTYGKTLILSSTKPSKASTSGIGWTVYLEYQNDSQTEDKDVANRTTNYTFKNWNTNSSGTGTSYSPGGSYTSNSSATLYAQWNSSTTISSITLPASAGAKTGYTFLGWSTNSSAATAAYAPGAKFTPSSNNMTLYGVWKKNTYVVSTAVTPSGSGSVSGSGTYSYQDTCTLTATANSGYSFLEWLQDGETAINGRDNPISFSVINNTQYTAVFERTLISANYVNNYGVSKYSITGPSTYTVGKDSSGNKYINLSLTLIPSDGYMITALEYCELSDTDTTEEWKVLTNGYKWYRANGETYNIAPQLKLSGSDTSVVKIRGVGYWFPRLRIGSRCYAIYTADGTPLIALYYDSQKGKWVPGE